MGYAQGAMAEKPEERESKITAEEIEETLQRSAEHADELRETLDRVFCLPSNVRNLVLD